MSELPISLLLKVSTLFYFNKLTFSLALADVVRTSLGPRGMDKMIQDSKGEVLITNDGATIMKQMEVIHPTAKMVHFLPFTPY